MDPSDIYKRMMSNAMNSQQQQAVDLASLRAQQKDILDSIRQKEQIAKENENTVPARFKDCEVIDAEFEVVPNEENSPEEK